MLKIYHDLLCSAYQLLISGQISYLGRHLTMLETQCTNELMQNFLAEESLRSQGTSDMNTVDQSVRARAATRCVQRKTMEHSSSPTSNSWAIVPATPEQPAR